MSVNVTSSIIFGLDVSSLDFLVLDENDMYDQYNSTEKSEYVYLAGDGDDYFGIPVDIATQGSYTNENLKSWSLAEIEAAVPAEARTKLLAKVQELFSEPDDGFVLDFLFTVTYS